MPTVRAELGICFLQINHDKIIPALPYAAETAPIINYDLLYYPSVLGAVVWCTHRCRMVGGSVASAFWLRPEEVALSSRKGLYI